MPAAVTTRQSKPTSSNLRYTAPKRYTIILGQGSSGNRAFKSPPAEVAATPGRRYSIQRQLRTRVHASSPDLQRGHVSGEGVPCHSPVSRGPRFYPEYSCYCAGLAGERGRLGHSRDPQPRAPLDPGNRESATKLGGKPSSTSVENKLSETGLSAELRAEGDQEFVTYVPLFDNSRFVSPRYWPSLAYVRSHVGI